MWLIQQSKNLDNESWVMVRGVPLRHQCNMYCVQTWQITLLPKTPEYAKLDANHIHIYRHFLRQTK